MDLILTSLPGQFQEIHSPDKLSDHDVISGTLKIHIPSPPPHPKKETSEEGVFVPKGKFRINEERCIGLCKREYFIGYSDNRSVQENFDLITSFIQESAEKHIPSKTSRSTSFVPWITPEIRRKIRRRNRTHAGAKKTGSSKLRAKFESLRREIKAD